MVAICSVTRTPSDQWSTATKGGKLPKVLARDNQKFRHATKFESLSEDEPDHVEFPDINSSAKAIYTDAKMYR